MENKYQVDPKQPSLGVRSAQPPTLRLDSVLDTLFQAQATLFAQMNALHWNNIEIVNGLYKLEYAFYFIKNWQETIKFCPDCGSIHLQMSEKKYSQCLDCINHWKAPQLSKFGLPGEPMNSSQIDSIHGALELLDQTLQVLEPQEIPNLIKASVHLKDSMQWFARALQQQRMDFS